MEVKINGEVMDIWKSKYQNNDRIALMLITKGGEPYATVTVNVPEIILEKNEVCIKNYSENEGILEQLISQGILSEPIYSVTDTIILIQICKLLQEIDMEDV
jgi:hypothetical protein